MGNCFLTSFWVDSIPYIIKFPRLFSIYSQFSRTIVRQDFKSMRCLFEILDGGDLFLFTSRRYLKIFYELFTMYFPFNNTTKSTFHNHFLLRPHNQLKQYMFIRHLFFIYIFKSHITTFKMNKLYDMLKVTCFESQHMQVYIFLFEKWCVFP